MPGDEWQTFANARAFLGYMFCHPGKKLLFMGSEIGQTNEWDHNNQVDWWLLDYEIHRRFQTYNQALNHFYRREPALWEVDFQYQGFEWIDLHDVEHSVLSFVRRGKRSEDYLVIVCNFTPQPHWNYRVGFPETGLHLEVFNSDAEAFGGSNMGNGGAVMAEPIRAHHRTASASLTLPPLGVIVFKPARPLPSLASRQKTFPMGRENSACGTAAIPAICRGPALK